MKTNPSHAKRARKGFTLVEVVIAIGIVTVLLTTFLALFGPAQRNIQRALNTKDITRMSDALDIEMKIRHSNETSKFITHFDKAFEWIKDSHKPAKAILIYQYSAARKSGSTPEDNVLVPYDRTLASNKDSVPGKDYLVVTAVRRIGDNDALIRSELKPGVVKGSVYVARMTQLIPQLSDGSFIIRTKTGIGNPLPKKAPEQPIDFDADVAKSIDYPSSYIPARVEFFRLRSNQARYVIDKWSTDTDGFNKTRSPLASTSFAVRR